MHWLLYFLQAGFAHGALRFGCSTISVQRLDPLVEPGANPSSHVHQVSVYLISLSKNANRKKIVGGNAFAPTMKGDIGEQANCTTCVYTEDFR